MSTGVPVAQACIDTYQILKQAKKNDKGNKHKFIIFALKAPKLNEIIVETISDVNDYEAFLEKLPPKEPRYAVYDVEYDADDGGKRSKLVFIAWSPDDAGVRQKMVYAGSRDSLKKTLDGIAVEMQAADLSDILYETVVDKLKRSSTSR